MYTIVKKGTETSDPVFGRIRYNSSSSGSFEILEDAFGGMIYRTQEDAEAALRICKWKEAFETAPVQFVGEEHAKR